MGPSGRTCVAALLLITLFGAVEGCGSSPSSASGTRTCEPGEAISCISSKGCPGYKLCNTDGTAYATCDCSLGPAGTLNSSAGASSSSQAAGGANAAAGFGGSSLQPQVGGRGGATTSVSSGGAGDGSATALPSSGGMPNSGGDNTVGGSTSNGGVSIGAAGTATGGNSLANAGTSLGGYGSANAGTAGRGQAATGGSTVTSICGDGIVSGSEGCDPLPKNNDLGDGCTPTCIAEPLCPPAGGPCSTQCGDGLVAGMEACDDGNAVGGDGCSASCNIEAGFQCTPAALGGSVAVPMVVRDFDAGGDFEKGAVFAMALDYANQGLLADTLDPKGLKPVLSSSTGTYNGASDKDSGIASPASFAQWYDDAAPAAGNTYHATLVTSLNLYLGTDGSTYANRYGTYGDGLTDAPYKRTHLNQCGTTTSSNHDASGNALPCTACYYNANDPKNLTPCSQNDTTPCQTDATYTGECVQNGTAWVGTFLDATFDGNPLFFPADPLPPYSPSSIGQVSGNYNPSWPADSAGKAHNFSFTTEVRFWFTYEASKTYQLTFIGDDDVWVFVNKHLAVDLGGIHTAVQSKLTLASGTGEVTVRVSPTNTPGASVIVTHPELGGLQSGSIYEVVVFQADRQSNASSYQLSSNGFNSARSLCSPL